MRRLARDGENPWLSVVERASGCRRSKERQDQVHTAHAKTFKNEKHKAQWMASLRADVFPVFGDSRSPGADE